MKPIAILRHTETVGPGYFATFLENHSIPWQLIAIDQGEPVPADPEAYSGFCLLGGVMSVNDPLPWIDVECALIRAAVEKNIPVIGHCLGGQLMSKALGGTVSRNVVKEIGWSTARIVDGKWGQRWLGNLTASSHSSNFGEDNGFPVFQWHGETFSVPPGAQLLFAGEACANQMFVLGPHLAMQCHLEITEAIIDDWCTRWGNEVSGIAPLPPSIQTPAQITAATGTQLPLMRKLADQLYSAWIRELRG